MPVKVHYGDPIQTTGFLSPSAEGFDTGGDGDGFELNPTNAFADGGGYAEDINAGTTSETTCNTANRDRHRYYDYGISIPAGSTIHGIEVRLDAWVDNGVSNAFICGELSWDGGTTWTAFRSSSPYLDIGTIYLKTSEYSFIVGGEADDWGRTWSNTEFTNTNFRLRITNVAAGTNRDFSLDWVAVEVYYTP